MKIVAMIPARLGSKRIPKKNIRYLLDRPLIQYPIDLANKSQLFNSVWVNTECAALKEMVESLSASFHLRPKELANDLATNRDFTYEFLKQHPCDYVVMVNTTSPLVSQNTLTQFIDVVKTDAYDTVLSVLSEKAETFFEDIPLNFSFKEKVNSQMLVPIQKVVWALTAWRRETFIKLQENGQNPTFGGAVGKVEIPADEAYDIDTEEDWRLVEAMLKGQQNTESVRYYF